MQDAVNGRGLDSHSIRQTEDSSARRAVATRPSANYSADAAPTLLNDKQAAQTLGIGVRTFHDLRSAPWMPRAIVLGPKIVRWARTELEQAIADMPRHGQSEPAQLRRGRIEAMKRGSSK